MNEMKEISETFKIAKKTYENIYFSKIILQIIN
jgi:hypothetical protein